MTKTIQGKPQTVKAIKARLTARGFKDYQAYEENIATFAGTASKMAQRLVCAFAAQQQYVLFSMDISAAFFKGMTYSKISQDYRRTSAQRAV